MGWGAWKAYGPCNKNCGGGSQSRSRSCDSPSPKYGGKTCPGSATQSQSCNSHNCPVDGKWGSWGGYGSCNKNCGSGNQYRYRSCNNPTPKHGGKTCPGSSSSSRS